jgi:hypothetical protein
MNKGSLYIIRDLECKLILPGPFVTTKVNGSLWYNGTPLLGIVDADEKVRCSALAKKKLWDKIPEKYFIKLGDNENGAWAGWTEDYAKHPVCKIKEEEARKKAEKEKLQVTIHLSTRGWGDYSSVEWVGDITQSNAIILKECKQLLTSGHDVDQPSQSDEDLFVKINAARIKWEAKQNYKTEAKGSIDHGAGYCYSCQSHCYGDCGDFQPKPTTNILMKDISNETAYGVND